MCWVPLPFGKPRKVYAHEKGRQGKPVWKAFDIIEGGVANDRVIDTVENYIAGMIDEERALGLLAMHRPNNQICILNQEVVEKYLRFDKSTKMKG